MAIGKFTDVLKTRGFQPFLWTQFLGAFNDNLYKMIVSLAAVAIATESGTGSRFLSLAQGIFILPFLLFSGYAGYFADTLSKRKVLVASKGFEVAAMSLAVAAFLYGRIEFMLAVLFLMALQSTFFSPAKYGILPEMVGDRDLSRGNALLQMTTFVAIILGTAVGGYFYAEFGERLWLAGLILVGIAVAGFMASFGIAPVPAAAGPRNFQLNPWGEIILGLRHLWNDHRLWLTVSGIAYFWFVGATMQIAVLLFGKQMLGASDLQISILVVYFAVGIGIGSMAAGRLSGDKVELGLVPIGAVGMGVFSLLLANSAPSYPLAATALGLLGFSSGFFVVPLNAFLQQRADAKERGRLLAAAGFLTNIGVMLAALASWFMSDWLKMPPDRVIFIVGVFTLLSTVYVLKVLPDFLIRFCLWLFTHTIYKIQIEGQEHVPFRGPALLVCNHVSMVDGLLVGASVQRFIRFMVYRPYYEKKPFFWILKLMNAIPIAGGDREKVAESLQRATRQLSEGHIVCIFAEGSVSRTGNLLPFKRGFERIVQDLDVPVIPVHLDGVWGSIFSFEKGRFLWKWPRRIPLPVTVSFGPPLPSAAKAHEVRRAVAELGTRAAAERVPAGDLLDRRFLRTARRYWFSLSMADSSGKEISCGKVLVGALALSRWIRKQCRGEEMVGLLLPASAGAAIANLAVLLAGKVPVNLNFTTGPAAMRSAVKQCGIRTVLTSRVFLKKAKLEELEGSVYLERALQQITPLGKAAAAVAAVLLPSRWLSRLFTPEPRDASSLATVIFSSGSTGTPKGVMLSHRNILSNVDAIAQLFWTTRRDRMMGVLPFFHSFGFTVTLWFPLIKGFPVIYHANPLDAKTIGEMIAKYKATILMSTPAFFSAYLRKCSAEQFSSLRHAIVGAERLRPSLAEAFQEKFGVPLLEGYGCTEMSPVVSVSTPGHMVRGKRQLGLKPGSVGHPLPGIAAKVVDVDSREPLPPNEEGLLLVKGPNVMRGYLGQPEKTAEVIQDGWYETGDIARIDDDGFIKITDRLSRFSKIGGEMIPHLKIEQVISEILGEDTCVVTAIPDEKKGEKLVVFYTANETTPSDLSRRLAESELPKLWVPRRENLYPIEEIPILGSGKTDLKQIRALALEMAGA